MGYSENKFKNGKKRKRHQFGVSRDVEMIWKELKERIVGECGKIHTIKSQRISKNIKNYITNQMQS